MLFKGFARKGTLALSSIVLALSLAACGTQTESQPNQARRHLTVKQLLLRKPERRNQNRRLFTVFPISQAVAEEFMKKHKDVKITVGESGSSNGVKKLLAGEIHIADMSKKNSSLKNWKN